MGHGAGAGGQRRRILLSSLALGVWKDRRWLWLTGGVAAFLLDHALRGWCPPLPVIRALGVRTAREIGAERTALKALRGDFLPTPETAKAALEAAHHQGIRGVGGAQALTGL